jgi:hypothetical protein
MKKALLAAAALLLGLKAAPVAAEEFYENKTLTLLINFAVGGNADVEARVYQRHLSRHIPGHPTIIIQNAPGAGGLNAMNILGLSLSSRPDGMTAGYFTMNPIVLILGDPGLRVGLPDFSVVAGAKGWNVAYGRKDMPPGLTQPADFAKATSVFAGGYSRSSAHDTRLRLALEVFDRPYKIVTGFPGTADVNKAMLQNEINFTGSSLPAFQTQAIPQIVNAGIGMPLFHFSVMGPDGKAVGNPSLKAQGIPAFHELYKTALGKDPSGPKWDALLLLGTLNTQMLRGVLLPKAAPDAALAALRQGYRSIAKDEEFLKDFERVIGERPDIVTDEELQPLFERMRNIDPAIKKVLQQSIDG